MCLYSYHAFFILSQKSEKCVKEIKDWTFEACLLTDETISVFLLIESLKMTFESAKSYLWVVLEFMTMKTLGEKVFS